MTSDGKFANSSEPVGVAFGKLLKKKRMKEQLTQKELAILAFDDETSKSRISELENGRVANPHARIVDALAIALNLTEEELDSCLTNTNVRTSITKEDLGLSNALLGHLAWAFGHENPDGSIHDYNKFLHEKAKQYSILVEQIARINASQEQVGQETKAAMDCISNGQFEKAELALRSIEKLYEKNSTAIHIQFQSEIRILRARAAILSGDIDAAKLHFFTAAKFFQPFETLQSSRTFIEGADALFDYGFRVGGNAIDAAISLYEEAFAERNHESHTVRIEAGLRLAEALRTKGGRLPGDKGNHLIERSVFICRELLTIQDPKVDEECRPSIYLGLAFSLWTLGERASETDAKVQLREAVDCCLEIISSIDRNKYPKIWSATQNRLGLLLWTIGQRDGETEELHLRKALSALKFALESRDRQDSPEEWAITMNNLGLVKTALARVVPNDEGKALLLEALDDLESACEIHNLEHHPIDWAMLRNNKGDAYLVISKKNIKLRCEALDNALNCFQEALEICTYDAVPYEWAKLKNNIGEAFFEKALDTSGTEKNRLLALSKDNFTAALKVFENKGARRHYKYVNGNLNKIKNNP